MSMERITLTTQPTGDYGLLDSGNEEKLERYGKLVLARPDPQALWLKRLSVLEWNAADGLYARTGREGEWKTKPGFPKEWEISFGGLQMLIRPTSFKHTGLFPEQEPNWTWLREVVAKTKRPVSAVNLFGYTGGATLAAAQAGAQVTHVDASKIAVAWAKENASRSGLSGKPIRWIVEDALVFVRREIKRGNRYDLIIMDPPAFGHGPKDELWKIEERLLELMKLCEGLLTDQPLGILMNGYAAGYSSLVFAYNLEPFAKKFGGVLQYGELTIAEKDGRMLPCGIYARWATV